MMQKNFLHHKNENLPIEIEVLQHTQEKNDILAAIFEYANEPKLHKSLGDTSRDTDE